MNGRRRRLTWIVVAVALLASATRGDRADAGEQDPMVVPPNATVRRTFGAILGENPGTDQVQAPRPTDCATLPVCDTIPLKIQSPPELTPFDQFFVTIELSWDPDPTRGGARDDLDLFLFTQYADRDPAARSVTAGVPERIRYSEPTAPDYWLTVNNTSGPNTGYEVKITSTYIKGERPPELDDRGSPSSSPAGAALEPSPPGSAAAGPAPYPPAVRPATTTTIQAGSSAPPDPGSATEPVPAAAAPDGDLASLQGATADGRRTNLFRTAQGARGPGGPVRGVTLVLWLAVVPLLLGGAAMVVFLRRRPKALRLVGTRPRS
jgi:hypothetical protein